ncbi:MAG TPA: phage holin family protein [Terriglobales bacterium]|nr:phage holin family protein [Terriglobales bacterium]
MNSNIHYIDEHERTANGRSIGATVNEAKEEFKRFAETRLAMLQAEMREKIANLKSSAPLLVIGGLLAATAFLVLTAGLVALVYTFFAGSLYATFLACVIVGVVYAIFGGAALFMGYRSITEKGLVPERTIKVLRDDKVWLQNEARTQL